MKDTSARLGRGIVEVGESLCWIVFVGHVVVVILLDGWLWVGVYHGEGLEARRVLAQIGCSTETHIHRVSELSDSLTLVVWMGWCIAEGEIG